MKDQTDALAAPMPRILINARVRTRTKVSHCGTVTEITRNHLAPDSQRHAWVEWDTAKVPGSWYRFAQLEVIE